MRHSFAIVPGIILMGWLAVPSQALAESSGAPSIVIPQDSVLHFLAGGAAGLLSAALASSRYGTATTDAYPLLLPAVGFSTALLAGLTKESVDSTGFGDPQWRDLRNTMIGGAAAALAIGLGEATFGKSAQRQLQLVGAVTGVFFSIPVAVGLSREIHAYLEKRRER